VLLAAAEKEKAAGGKKRRWWQRSAGEPPGPATGSGVVRQWFRNIQPISLHYPLTHVDFLPAPAEHSLRIQCF
jgi:hypothetical protein